MSVRRVGVIGGGFVGYMSALWVSRLIPNAHVSIIERQKVIGGKESASYGCAGSFASYAFYPINSPLLFQKLPHLLGMIDSETRPLSFRWDDIFTMRKWIFQFLRHCTPSEVERITQALSNLTVDSIKYYEPFIDQINNTNPNSNLKFLISPPTGAMCVFNTKQAQEDALSIRLRRRKLGMGVVELAHEETRKFENSLDPQSYYSSDYIMPIRFTTDPSLFLSELNNLFLKSGKNSLVNGNVVQIRPEQKFLSVFSENENGKREHMKFDNLVVAGGAYSNEILQLIGDDEIPLDTERGYHVMLEYSKEQIRKEIPKKCGLKNLITYSHKGFYFTPMNNGIRVAGLVEIGGGTKAPADESKFDYLIRGAHEVIPISKEMNCVGKWLGFRPTLPDSLPVIGKSRMDSRIIYNFGHQHIGMTLAGISGNIVSKIISHSEPLPVDIEPYSPERFYK